MTYPQQRPLMYVSWIRTNMEVVGSSDVGVGWRHLTEYHEIFGGNVYSRHKQIYLQDSN